MDRTTSTASMGKATATRVGRRDFLRLGGACALAAVGVHAISPLRTQGAGQEEKPGRKAGAAEEEVSVSGPYAPFKMSVQSYTFRKFGFEKMAAAVNELELKFVELYPEHFPIELGEAE